MTTPAGHGAAEPPRPGAVEIAEMAVVFGAVVQGALIGGWLALWPASAVAAGGFAPMSHLFVRRAGLLELLLAVGYALEWSRTRHVTLLVAAKAATAAFLGFESSSERLPALLVFAILAEAVTALLAGVLHGPASRARHARARLHLVSPGRDQVRPAGRR